MVTVKGSTLTSFVKKYKKTTTATLVGVPVGCVLLYYLIFTGTLTVGSYEANKICGGEDVCWLNLYNVTFVKAVTIEPMNICDVINARPSDVVSSCRMYLDGKELNFSKKVSIKKGKYKSIRFELNKPINSTVSWQINPEGTFYGWNYIYANKTVQEVRQSCHTDTCTRDVPIYSERIVYVACNDTSNASCIQYNDSLYFERIEQYVAGYNKETYDCEQCEPIYLFMIVPDETSLLGVQVCNNTFLGNIYIDPETLSMFRVPVGDRNWKEYGTCRDYEIQKGVCEEINLTEVCQ